MRCLIVEDDAAARDLMEKRLSGYCDCSVAPNGRMAVNIIRQAVEEGNPFDLVCLDIMMPEMDGHETLMEIRRIERAHGITGINGVKVIMTTALDDAKTITSAFRTGCESYIVKPIKKEKLLEEMRNLGLLNDERVADDVTGH